MISVLVAPHVLETGQGNFLPVKNMNITISSGNMGIKGLQMIG
jgi:hypothetical protein